MKEQVMKQRQTRTKRVCHLLDNIHIYSYSQYTVFLSGKAKNPLRLL